MAANHAEVKLALMTLDRVRVPRRRGRPRKRPEELVADRAYDSDRFRAWLWKKRVGRCTSPRKNLKRLASGKDVCLAGKLSEVVRTV